ncbi:hypothetical protein EG68_03448 [Paragonimus skrjabini miyazakii]|uniref:Apple domain-containing protein n=1 Tax=Paragonimus skrjabini miyazakii TaxID=59628 RepID=A0A8S9Z1M8_9TREM|nr:hypothetical protein EG68_03448 [Paragonimus skrjabini miyazakii]
MKSQMTYMIACCLLYQLSIRALQALTCPIGLKDVGDGLCMIAFNQNVSYCYAHRLCNSEGRNRGICLFLVGKHANKLPVHFAGYGLIFTGVHNFLNDGRIGTFTWKVSDPGAVDFVSDGSSLPWMHGEPNIYAEPIVACSVRGCSNIPQHGEKHPFVCEMYNPSTVTMQYVTYFKFRAPSSTYYDQIGITDTTSGCVDHLNQQTLTSCVFKCQINEVCRASYYNRVSMECLHTMFVDSLLAKYYDLRRSSWVRFKKIE